MKDVPKVTELENGRVRIRTQSPSEKQQGETAFTGGTKILPGRKWPLFGKDFDKSLGEKVTHEPKSPGN